MGACSGGSSAEQASLLLHHLLNQSLSGLDFCTLWQQLSQKYQELQVVDGWVQKFLAEADLAALDRALALLPEPLANQPLPALDAAPPWQKHWTLRCLRLREVTRAEFCCVTCGWEIVYTLEHPPNTEFRMPFDHLECPYCADLDGRATLVPTEAHSMTLQEETLIKALVVMIQADGKIAPQETELLAKVMGELDLPLEDVAKAGTWLTKSQTLGPNELMEAFPLEQERMAVSGLLLRLAQTDSQIGFEEVKILEKMARALGGT